MTDTWFEACALIDGSGYIILRMDRATLPTAVVVRTGIATLEEALAIAEEMRGAGHA